MEESIIKDNKAIASHPDDNLLDFVELLQDIDEKNPLAELNEISMTDSKGGRIYY